MKAGLPMGFLRHFRAPRNVGRVEDADWEWERKSPWCQDTVRFSLRLKHGRLEALRFHAYGCGVAIAAASAATEWAKGKRPKAVLEARVAVLERLLGPLPERKRRCVAFVWEALVSGLKEREERA